MSLDERLVYAVCHLLDIVGRLPLNHRHTNQWHENPPYCCPLRLALGPSLLLSVRRAYSSTVSAGRRCWIVPSSALVELFAAAALTAAAVGSRCGEEACGLFGELFRKLEVRAVSGIRVEDQPGIRQMLLKDVGIDGRHHDVVFAVDDKRALLDLLQIAVAVCRGDRTPFSKSDE